MDDKIRFLSALALFKTLYSKHKDVLTLVSQFIVTAMQQSQRHSFAATDVQPELEKCFNFTDIPTAIISKCLRITDYFSYKGGLYSLQKNNHADDVDDSVITTGISFNIFLDEVVNEIEKIELHNLSSVEKNALRDCLYEFLQEKGDEKSPYFKYISSAIIRRENDLGFRNLLNDVREGLIIYNGVRYESNFEGKKWKDATVFFLDAHYLFSATGLNGELYKQYFSDFHKLQEEINKKGAKQIRLKYFSETKDVVERFFKCAERIKEGIESEHQRTEAMSFILNNTHDATDVVRLKSQFFHDLSKLGIVEYDKFDFNWERNKDFLFDTENLLDEIANDYNPYEEEEGKDYLRIADYINILRHGRLYDDAHNMDCVFLTDSHLAIAISHKIKEQSSQYGSRVFEHMDRYTEKMWLHLGKALSNDVNWSSFDVINRTKTAVSGLFNEKLTQVYKELEGHDTKENENFYAELRSRNTSAESITFENVASEFTYWNEINLEKYKNEQALLRQKAKQAETKDKELIDVRELKEIIENENISLKRQLREEKFKTILKNRKRSKRFFKISVYSIIFVLIVVFVVSLSYWIYVGYIYYASTDDMVFLKIQNILAGITIFSPISFLSKRVKRNVHRMNRKLYKNIVKNNNDNPQLIQRAYSHITKKC